MKAYKETVRKYYKYQYKDWQQPILTSNAGTPSFTVSATNEGQGAAYGAFNGDTSTGWATANNVTTGTLTAVLDKDIYITSIGVVGESNQWGSTNTITIYSDTNKQTIIGEQKSFNYSVSKTLAWTFEEPIKAKTLVFYGTGTTWVSIREITITAQEQVTVESLQDDYDFYEDIDIYKLPVKTIDVCKQASYSQLSSLPTYASLAEGQNGKEGISFTPANMYPCIAKDEVVRVTNSSNYPVTWSFGEKTALLLESCSFTGYVIANQLPAASLSKREASNDGINWVTITPPTKEYYKYYRFTFVGSETNRYANMGMRYFNLTGVLRKTVLSEDGKPIDYYIQYNGIED